jgi:hypothetical protein
VAGYLSIALIRNNLHFKQTRGPAQVQQLQLLLLWSVESRLAAATHKKVRRVRSRSTRDDSSADRQSCSPSHRLRERLQSYCTTCIHYPTHGRIRLAILLETFQAGSRQQPHLTRWPNRRVKHHKDTLSHRVMVVISSQYSGRM